MGLISRVSSRTYRIFFSFQNFGQVLEKPNMNSLLFTLSRRTLSPREVNQVVGQVRASNARFDLRRKPINNATLEDARAESRKLYKAYLRAVPEIMENYKVTEIS